MPKKMKYNDWNELRKIIDDGMAKQDRKIFIGFYESATLVTIAPMSTDEEELPETPSEGSIFEGRQKAECKQKGALEVSHGSNDDRHG